MSVTRGSARNAMMTGAALMVMMAYPAAAQTAAPSASVSPPADQTAAPAAQSPDGSVISDIVVTAQKRSESVQKIPLAVTAISADTLKTFSTSDVRRLQDYVPSLRLSTNGAGTQINIRGIGNSSDGGNGDPAAAFNLDGVYLARPQASTSILYDIDRVEVLRGPQGTLYGRNADAGAINVVTTKPAFTFGGNGEMEVGNYGLIRATGALNVPVSDTLAIRGAFQVVGRDGYISNGTSDADTLAGRLHVLWKPDDATSVLLTGDYSRQGGLGSQQVVLLTPRDEADKFKSDIPSQGFVLKGDGWSGTMTVDHDFGPLTGTVIASHREQQTDQRGYAAGLTYTTSYIDSKVNSVEARLGSNGGPLTWTAGLYYFREQQAYLLNFQLAPTLGLYTSYPDFTTTSVAAFGQASYPILPGLRLTAGARYTSDTKKAQDGTFGLDVMPVVGRGGLGPILTASSTNSNKNWKDFSWKLGIDGDIADGVLGYANVAKGYKAGGFFSGLPPTNTYDPEKLIAYAAGIKSTLFDRKLRFNAEAFYWDYTNYQISSLGLLDSPPNPPGALSLIVRNAGKAEIYGIETETVFAATPHDRFTLNLSYLHATFTNLVVAGQPGQSTGDFSGNRLPHAPDWSGTIGYQHDFDLANGGQVTAAAQTHAESRQYLLYFYSNAPGPGTEQKGYTMSSASLGYHAPDDLWHLSFYVKNIENRAVANISAESPSEPGNFYGELNPPRTYGATFGVKW